MKRLLVVPLVACTVFISHGQDFNLPLVKGNWIGSARGGVNYYSNSQLVINAPSGFTQSEPFRYTKISIGPEGAYFFTSRIALGLDMHFGIQLGNGNTDLSAGLGPLFYYFHPIAATTALFLTATAAMRFQEGPNSLSGGGGAGLAFFLNPNIAFTMALLYTLECITYPDGYFYLGENYDLRYRDMCMGLKVGFTKFFDCGGPSVDRM
jgi:hypothetical protein